MHLEYKTKYYERVTNKIFYTHKKVIRNVVSIIRDIIHVIQTPRFNPYKNFVTLKRCYCRLTLELYRSFAVFNLSYSCARLYNNTPIITSDVPIADKPVTGLLNNRTESQINDALFAVLTTLQ